MSQLLPTPAQAFNSSDISSLANLDEIICKHHSISIAIDFAGKKLNGKITYHLEALKETSTVDLDVRNIHVSSCSIDGVQLSFKILKYVKITETLGDQLRVTFPVVVAAGTQVQLIVEYSTLDSKESALNWLAPSQTEGKQHPYLFTQSEPVWNRTIFPCQDSPAFKQTFDARVSVPKPHKAYVSGNLKGFEVTETENISIFEQKIPIPSYLFAIVAGNLVERKISERTSVISEPEVIDKSSKELEDMEIQLTTLEKIVTPYEWQEYKVAVLPPSFPYGGMENPLLTFASPSIIVGDKSSTSVIIHEMAHSWSGNLFSCKNWNSFWLNEAWTVFFEAEAVRILEGEESYKMMFVLGEIDLKKTIDEIGHDHSYTTLNPENGFDNPDDAFSTVCYYRGFHLLSHIRDTVGVEVFKQFTVSFVNHFKLKSLDTNDFLNFFKSHFGEEIYNKFAWDEWINKRGYPPQVFNVQSEAINATKAAAAVFLATNIIEKNVWDSYKVKQKMIFLQEIGTAGLSAEQAQILDETLNLGSEKNPEIYTVWFPIALASRYHSVIPHVQTHLSLHGRMKYVRHIYKSLSAYDHQLAVDTFNKNADLYYGITYNITKAELKI